MIYLHIFIKIVVNNGFQNLQVNCFHVKQQDQVVHQNFVLEQFLSFIFFFQNTKEHLYNNITMFLMVFLKSIYMIIYSFRKVVPGLLMVIKFGHEISGTLYLKKAGLASRNIVHLQKRSFYVVSTVCYSPLVAKSARHICKVLAVKKD